MELWPDALPSHVCQTLSSGEMGGTIFLKVVRKRKPIVKIGIV